MIADQAQRIQALNIAQSFIVQAPAGSGKTELLIQRYLTLLAHAQKSPAEILAITFTRKAAAEMQSRIINVLIKAAEGVQPTTEHELTTFNLAQQVLAQDKKLHWQLIENPQQLNILTIDALNLQLTQRMPTLVKLSANSQTTEDAYPYYVNAVRKLFSYIETHLTDSPIIQKMLLHLDNDYRKIEALFTHMLNKRDQWLPYIVNKRTQTDLRAQLENGLKLIITENLAQCRALVPASITLELVELARYAASNLDKNNPIYICQALTQLPGNELSDLPTWLAITQLLLTEKHTWRAERGINKTIGFPAKNNYKERMQQLIAGLPGHEAWRIQLESLRYLPPAYYSNDQWQALQGFLQLLPQLAAHLTLEFQTHNIADFTEIALQALHALGDSEDPSDLALRLDYQIQHILVDEFQDTSPSQMRLLEKLTTGWEPSDGRTLFLVGDPMQSIYRFREADVGLFLRTRHEGINNIQLQPLTLTVNFRSQAPIIEWINQTFTQLFPKTENISEGAVPFSASLAFHNNNANANVLIHELEHPTAEFEANTLLNIIYAAQAEQPQQSIAILVRSRNHLTKLIPLLKQAGIIFSAPEIEKLTHRALIQDLFSLTKALLQPADTIAWLAILRAPWCGLTLSELDILVNKKKHTCLLDTLQDIEIISSLNAESQIRIQHFVAAITTAMAKRNRIALAELIENTWLQLHGPACITEAIDLENVELFFDLLTNIEQANPLIDLHELERQLEKLYATSVPTQIAQVQIMTIHKAKGLEFDTVIIPGLHRKPTHEGPQLLLWWERPRATQGSDLILAPINAADYKENTSIYSYVAREHKKKIAYEAVRLLYVATTRARKNLHLIAAPSAYANSFLNILRPAIYTQLKFTEADSNNANSKSLINNAPNKLKRLTSDYLKTCRGDYASNHGE